MTGLEVPEGGLLLCRDHRPADPASSKPTQIMRLNLAQSTLDDLIHCLRNDQKARIRLGKYQTLYYGSKSQPFHATPEAHRSELYQQTTSSSLSTATAEKENLYFTGVLSHTLEVQKAKEATAATDQALANLEQSLNAFERGKEFKKTHIITSIDEVRALKAGDSRSSTGRQAALLARAPTSRIEIEKDRFFNKNNNSSNNIAAAAAHRSLPSSPALSIPRSPGAASVPPLHPTSAPPSQNKDRIRLEALKVPFIHLLAIRAVSAKFLAKQTRSSLDDCLILARKYAVENRIDREKFDLRDKVYRDLDIWNFPYQSQEDRQEAIENAISAFDRMRISRTDKLWQMLLPAKERGKGKCLSRLDLRTGPIKKAATPRIHVQGADDTGKEGYSTGTETVDRGGGGGGNTGGLTPQIAERTATPRVSSATSTPTTTAQKKRPGEKETLAKRTPSSHKATTASPATAASSKSTNNSTLTGRVTKKTTERKPVVGPKVNGKFKSAEFVHDSDSDDLESRSSEGPGTKKQPLPPAIEKPSASIKTVPTSKPSNTAGTLPKATTTAATATATAAAARPPSRPLQPNFTAIASKRLPSVEASKRLPSSRATNSTSPRKPSPLGSSPTNASDSHAGDRSSSLNSTSSSSSSPLIAHLSRPTKPTIKSTADASLLSSGGSTAATTITTTAATAAAMPLIKNSLKRKAEQDRPSVAPPPTAGRVTGSLEHKRRRAFSASTVAGKVTKVQAKLRQIPLVARRDGVAPGPSAGGPGAAAEAARASSSGRSESQAPCI
ncbi:hypothetical protein ASPZODRAFT_824365 [Penicilliopsis zonata CBS 506.65]|uniref:Uncharacterized protein n=1 Tax=Penicilliopsis zonata CBS 506.65 TaxID=1073090 RepID=A0A1L9SAB4_9EURO|nr:hypothetical protein ASPZODRAFT_824365 [Penicilliopsis zonata CBS 506.65]OJJ44067.1 hypothetical protein ASPZODRAFT_824365 [Penicilliopsis zonata CBS 506.65]